VGLEGLDDATALLRECFGDSAELGADFFITELLAKLKNASPTLSTGTRLTTVLV
jgi:hypothetical protein